jgi:hypothetical protein
MVSRTRLRTYAWTNSGLKVTINFEINATQSHIVVLTTAVKTAQSKNLLKNDVSAKNFKLAIFDKGSLDALLSNNQQVRF